MCGPSFNVNRSHSVPISNVQSQDTLNHVNPPQVNEPQDVDNQRGFHEVSNQLTQLLDRISKRSTVSVNLSDIEMLALNKKQKANALAFQQLLNTAKTAEYHLNLLSTVKGNEIALAFNPNTKEWFGNLGTRIDATSKALADLSNQLLNLLKNPTVMADDKLYEVLKEKYLKSCCRQSEFHTILMSIVDLRCENQRPITEDDRCRLAQSVNDWMVKLPPNMHGSDTTLNIATTESFQQIQALLAEFEGEDQANIPQEKRQALLAAVQGAQAHVHELATASTTIDKDFFRSAEVVFKQIFDALNTTRQTAINSVVTRHIKACIDLPPQLDFSDALVKELASSKMNCPHLAKFIQLRRSISQLVKSYVATAQTPNVKQKALKALREKILDANNKLYNYIREESIKKTADGQINYLQFEADRLNALALYKRDPRLVGKEDVATLPNILDEHLPELLKLASIAEFSSPLQDAHNFANAFEVHFGTLENLLERFKTLDEDLGNTKQLLSSIFTQELPISAIVECRVNGIQDRDINPSLCDANILKTRAFGKGSVNAVYEVSMKNDRTYIFKAENSGRSSVGTLAVSINAYESDVNITALNIAAHEVADALGLGHLIVSSKVGICNGQLGVFMEKASGSEAHNFVTKVNRKGAFFNDLDDETFLKVNGGLMKQAYNLEWVDFIIGSGDRHNGNYFVDINKATSTVTLKGIDNDMTFGKYRTSFTDVTLSGSRTKSFLLNCQATLEKYANLKLSTKKFLDKLATIDGIFINDKTGDITINLAKVNVPWIRNAVHNATGMYQLVPPRFIDKGLYERLMALDNDDAKAAYRARLQGRINEKNIDAAMNRLSSAIQYAKDLYINNRVIAHWEDCKTQLEIFNKHIGDQTSSSVNFVGPNVKFISKEINNPENTSNLYFHDINAHALDRLVMIANKIL